MPFVALALVALSFVTLQGDASALRSEVMAATDHGWKTKVQVSIGGFTVAAAQTVLAFVHHPGIADARLALSAVRRASVGVYERTGPAGKWSGRELLEHTDETMARRGFARLVGVNDASESVLVYGPKEFSDDESVDLCIAVVQGRELVVVSTRIDATKLTELIERQLDKDGHFGHARFASLHF